MVLILSVAYLSFYVKITSDHSILVARVQPSRGPLAGSLSRTPELASILPRKHGYMQLSTDLRPRCVAVITNVSTAVK